MSARPAGAVLLGAGYSKRFGGDKRLAQLGQLGPTTVAETTAATYRSVFDQVRIVLRPEDSALRNLLQPFGTDFVESADSHLGMGHSLAAGAQDLPWSYAFIGLLDMPFVRADTLLALDRLAAASNYQQIVRPVFQGPDKPAWGHPLGIPADLFGHLSRLTGDTGAREVIRANQSRVVELPTDDSGVWRDVDRPSDLPT